MKIFKSIIIGGLVGTGIGLVLGVCILACQDIFAFITCSTYNPRLAFNIGVVCIPICAVIGLINGIFEEKERVRTLAKQKEEEKYQEEKRAKELAKRKEEEKKQEEIEKMRYRIQAAKKEFSVWSGQVAMYYRQIENKTYNITVEDVYKSILLLNETKDAEEYRNEFKKQLIAHIARMRKRILVSESVELMDDGSEEIRRGGLEDTIYACKCLMLAETMLWGNKSKVIFYQPLLNILESFAEETKNATYYLKFESYGLAKFLLDDSKIMEEVTERVQGLERKLSKAWNYIISLKDGKGIGEEGIPSEFDRYYIDETAMLMWYYAKKKPFDIEKFTLSQKFFREFTSIIYIQEKNKITVTKVEDVLARIYAKNQMGGINTARQEVEYMNIWLEKKIKGGFFEECYALASGLAWMELYELELGVLRKLVEKKVQLPEALQERLRFLESGELTNVMIYMVEETEEFLFDNASLEWGTKEYNVFFRKINMKKMWPNYSLAINKWAKTIPLLKGQKVSFENIYKELSLLVEDFDGEIVCSQKDARAINLANVVYRNAMIFDFTTERNRCVSVVLSGEKYGRNLNITIITMFTPDKKLGMESLEKYCFAIKNNTYVESLRESILQTIDESLKVRESVYEDVEQELKKKMFDEEEW